MHVLTHSIVDTRRGIAAARSAGKTIGLVPTMGALHEGHAALIRRARSECGYVVVSIFVNPTQFGPKEDFSRYPRTLPEDRMLCDREQTDLVFAPDTAEIYPAGFRTVVDVRELGDHLCGPSRPGHFSGVATIVLKLLNIVQPDRAFLGQKDAQQARIIQQIVRDLDVPTAIVVVPTVREEDGVAMSSRNRYLDAADRGKATVLVQALREVRARFAAGERDGRILRTLLTDRIAATPGAKLDYAEIVDADSFQPIEQIAGAAVAALAVKFGATRLIDNIDLNPGK
jgi:pantoate--beta-alanine ligase